MIGRFDNRATIHTTILDGRLGQSEKVQLRPTIKLLNLKLHLFARITEGFITGKKIYLIF